MKMTCINKIIEYVAKPHWMSNAPEMGHDLNDLLKTCGNRRRHIQKIIIEVNRPTTIHYFTVTGRWANRLYESGFMVWGTL